MKNKIETSKAPAAIGPYSQAISFGSWVFCSGQIPLDPENPQAPMPSTIEEQTERVLKNIEAVLKAADLSFKDVVKTTIFLTDMAHFQKVNEVYGKYFTAPFPARSTVAVKELPRGAWVEIEVLACRG